MCVCVCVGGGGGGGGGLIAGVGWLKSPNSLEEGEGSYLGQNILKVEPNKVK